MAPPKVDLAKLKDQVNELLARQKLKEALAAYLTIEKAEPKEPRWPHRKGDLQLRMKLTADAIRSYERAIDLYVQQGFAARGAALAKVVLGLDPSRKDVLARVDGQAMREIRDANQRDRAEAGPPAPAPETTQAPAPVAEPSRLPASPPAAAVRPEPPARPAPRPSLVDELLSQVPTRVSFVFDAPVLEVDRTAAEDEVRFVDSPSLVEIELEEIEIESLPPDARGSEEPMFFDPDPPAIEELVEMPMVPLFADVPQEALTRMLELSDLVELEDGEVLVRRGDEADSLFILADGRAEVRLPDGQGIPLSEGEVVGETCLFANMTRRADVVARGRLRALRLERPALEVLVSRYPALGGILYDLLTRRLVSNILRQSELFTAFDPATRLEVGRLFEVRRAPATTTLVAQGKRADGLYVLLLGELEATLADGRVLKVPTGTMLGEQSLLTRAPSSSTLVATSEAILLRLPTSRFTELASMYPAVLEHLANLAARGSFEELAATAAVGKV